MPLKVTIDHPDFARMIVAAAEAHADATAELDFVPGDLEVFIKACWKRLTPAQRLKVLADPAVVELFGLPEYQERLDLPEPTEE